MHICRYSRRYVIASSLTSRSIPLLTHYLPPTVEGRWKIILCEGEGSRPGRLIPDLYILWRRTAIAPVSIERPTSERQLGGCISLLLSLEECYVPNHSGSKVTLSFVKFSRKTSPSKSRRGLLVFTCPSNSPSSSCICGAPTMV